MSASQITPLSSLSKPAPDSFPPLSKAANLAFSDGVPEWHEHYLEASSVSGVLSSQHHINLTSWGLFSNVVLHFAAYIPSLFVVAGVYLGGNWNWLAFFAGWVVIPVLDLALGSDAYNLSSEEEPLFRASFWFRFVTWWHFPIQVALVTFVLLHIAHTHLNWFAYIGLLLSVGTVQGFGIGCVHELIHRPQFIDLSLGIVSLVYSTYGHFWIEHLWSHHRNVATRLDPATSEIGETVYQFLPKVFWKSWVEANEIEARIQRQQGNAPYGLQNRIVQAYLLSAAIAIFYGITIGWHVVPFFVLQGWVAAAVVENTNYIEHYGLRRKELSNGEFEPVGWFHSWDTGAVFTNTVLFKIQRHPDHHTNAGRPYQILRNIPEAPKLPTGYAGMIALSWFPPLFFSVMDWRAKAYSKQAHEYFLSGKVNGKDPFPKERRAVASRFENIDFQVLPENHFVPANKTEEEEVQKVRSNESKKSA